MTRDWIHEFWLGLLAFGIWLLAFGFWPLAFGLWLLAFGLIEKISKSKIANPQGNPQSEIKVICNFALND